MYFTDNKKLQRFERDMKIVPNFERKEVSAPIQNENTKTTDNENDENEDNENKTENKHYSPKVQEMLEQFSGKIID